MEDLDIKIGGLITNLEQLGEDKDELDYWRSIVEYMSSEQKEELTASLETEQQELTKLIQNK